MKCTVELTAEQLTAFAPMLATAGLPQTHQLLGEIHRARYDGDATTAGRWVMTACLVPVRTAQAMRKAYHKASTHKEAPP